MKKLTLFIFSNILLFSCVEKTTYRLQLLIKNENQKEITVTLFPKKTEPNGMYMPSEGTGLYRYSGFNLKSNDIGDIYTTSDLKISPDKLAVQIFDSIHVRIRNENEPFIRFTPNRVIGNSKNIMSQKDAWKFEIVETSFPTMFKEHPAEYRSYTFIIE